MIQAISFRRDRSPVPPRVKIGFESDNLVESLAFELPELASDQSAMLMISGNAYANMIDLHRTEDGKWAVDLTAEMVGPAGVYESYVAITCPDGRRWNSGVFDLLTGDLPDISDAIETLYPTAVEHVLQEMAETRQEMAASVTASEDAAQRAEDAAQRAENAANQGGGGEAPAKDAVLYTAQELTEAQKAQARENIGAASEEAVGKLYEDKADKADIPEPYTLPVASADTLGGVKVTGGANDMLLLKNGVVSVNTTPVTGLHLDLLYPDVTTVVLNTMYRWGPICNFVLQIQVKEKIEGEYSFALAKLPYASMDRVWYNNSTQFFTNQEEKYIRVNSTALNVGNYIISGLYFTTDKVVE